MGNCAALRRVGAIGLPSVPGSSADCLGAPPGTFLAASAAVVPPLVVRSSAVHLRAADDRLPSVRRVET